MLAYLDDLCHALIARDTAAIRRLLRHPLARALPRRVREEGFAIARAGANGHLAPVQTLHFYYQTVQLLTEPSGRTDQSGTLDLLRHEQRDLPIAAANSRGQR